MKQQEINSEDAMNQLWNLRTQELEEAAKDKDTRKFCQLIKKTTGAKYHNQAINQIK